MTSTTAIDRSIYPMPMFGTLLAPDVEELARFYHRLGFISLATIPGPGGGPAVIHLRRAKYQDLLLVPGDSAPGSAYFSFAAHGEDLDVLAERVREDLPSGATVTGPTATPWFTTDLTVTDPQGHVVVLTAQREQDAAAAQEFARTFAGDWERSET
jgi:hypothetical protein